MYGAIALLALVGTWGNNLGYMHLGLVGANLRFWQDTLANPASKSITVDLFFLGLAVFLWMVLEARRLKMRGVWLYLIVGMLVAISVSVPVFLINRERALARLAPASHAGELNKADALGFIGVIILICAYTALTFMSPA